jgi:hypothetical protein
VRDSKVPVALWENVCTAFWAHNIRYYEEVSENNYFCSILYSAYHLEGTFNFHIFQISFSYYFKLEKKLTLFNSLYDGTSLFYIFSPEFRRQDIAKEFFLN